MRCEAKVLRSAACRETHFGRLQKLVILGEGLGWGGDMRCEGLESAQASKPEACECREIDPRGQGQEKSHLETTCMVPDVQLS